MRTTELQEHLNAALRIAEAMTAPETTSGSATVQQVRAEANRAIQHSRALVLALLCTQPVPVSLFKPWCSYSVLWRMEQAGRLKMHRANRKACIVPSEFFAVWASMRDDAR